MSYVEPRQQKYPTRIRVLPSIKQVGSIGLPIVEDIDDL